MTTQNNFECELCDYKTNLKTNLERHLVSNKHIAKQQKKEIEAENILVIENQYLKSKLTQLENDMLTLKTMLTNNQSYGGQGVTPPTEPVPIPAPVLVFKRNKNPLTFLNKERADVTCDVSLANIEKLFKIEESDFMSVLNNGFLNTVINIIKRESRNLGGLHMLPFASTTTRKRIMYVKEVDGWTIDCGNKTIKDIISYIGRIICRNITDEWCNEHSNIKSTFDTEQFESYDNEIHPKTSGLRYEISTHCIQWDVDSKVEELMIYNCERDLLKAIAQLVSIDHLLDTDTP